MRKVLIVDDNALNRSMLHNILDKDYDVLDAENGREALDVLFRKHKLISAVLLDLLMPVMDGFEVLRGMRNNTVLSQIPVIVATGSSEEDMEVKALALGANDFITKPYNPTLIQHCLRNTINLRETASIVNAIQRDKLTGLYNREAFFDRVSCMVREQEPGYYLLSCFDVDNFKLINDQYGAEEGDRILRHVGKVILHEVTAIGGVCARISADNFALLYPAGEAEIAHVTKIRDTRFTPQNSHVALTFSVGRYVITDPFLSASTLYDRAYLAKRSVKGRYDQHIAYFDESMLEKLTTEQAIISEMDAALATGQFEVWYQPQYNHATGALIGAEALARWRHPDRGLISPGEFVPVFEQNGFIYELDKYVWERVCQTLARWLGEGRKPLPVSVNISRYDIFRADLIDVIAGLLEKYQVDVSLLRLEITESAFTESTLQIIAVVRRLIRRGFTVEIDDFGSGYSSLNTLKDVPANVLKLDMRFLESTKNSERGGNILESVVRMAKWLDMSVIAEGVETMDQADFLKSIGCNYIQGYLYSRPVPLAEYEVIAMGAAKEQRMLALDSVKNFDNNAFWSPSSMDSLVFNTYIGCASILEYRRGKTEILRVNDKYLQLLGSAGMPAEEALRMNWTAHMSPSDAASFSQALEIAVQTGEETVRELVFAYKPGETKSIWLCLTLRVISSTGDRFFIYCTFRDVTKRKNAEQELRETDERLRFLNDAAHDLLKQPDSALGLQLALEKMIHYFGGRRAQIFELDEGGETITATYEVCAPGVCSEKARFQRFPCREMGEWLSQLRRSGYLNVESGAGAPPLMPPSDMRSAIAVPLLRDGRLLGLVSIDDPTRERNQASRMAALGDYIAVMLTRRDLNDKLKNDSLSLLDNLPCGAALYEYDGKRLFVAHVNDRYKELVGRKAFSKEDITAMDAVHPDDRPAMLAALKGACEQGKMVDRDLRIRYGDGREYRLFHIVGRVSPGQDGKRAIYATYTPISYETQSYQKMFLSNGIPGGLATYRCTQSSVEMVYFNDGLPRLFGYTREEYLLHARQDPMSLIFPEDVPEILQRRDALMRNGGAAEQATCRVRVKGGGYKWLSCRAVAAEVTGDTALVNMVLMDVTELKETMERLRISEEEHRLTVEHSGIIICRYQIADKTLYLSEAYAAVFGLSTVNPDVPYAMVRGGEISPDTAEGYTAFYESILRGEPSAAVVFRRRMKGSWAWMEGRSSTIYADDGKPVSAVISFIDVTDRMEKETIYRKWQQSFENRSPESYTLLKCNMSKNSRLEAAGGGLLSLRFDPSLTTFDEYMERYGDECVLGEDRERYQGRMRADAMLASYYRGSRAETVEYREELPSGGVRWLRLTAELVECPNSTDVDAYLLFENIDQRKRQELATLERAERDPLTGALNRVTFTARMEEKIAAGAPGALSALMILDVDGFKLVNDAFGHGAGDRALMEIAAALRAALGKDDLLGRLGGDEFMVFAGDAQTEAAVMAKARKICALVRKSFDAQVQITGSVGVALCPRDGSAFDALYQKADEALYRVKGQGKNGVQLYSEDGSYGEAEAAGASGARKRRMLIVDDNEMDCAVLCNIFKNSFLIDKAKDGGAALIKLRHYGGSLSVVLLDLYMPGVDGFSVLEKMQNAPELRGVPVIALSGEADERVGLEAVRGGAADFIQKPVDPQLLRIRVDSAVIKAENERARARSRVLEIESDELAKYRLVLEHSRVAVVEYDWLKGEFNYDSSVSRLLCGYWDGRKLWHILLVDMVADVSDVRAMQELVHGVAQDRARLEASMRVAMKTPDCGRHWFRMSVYKRTDEYQLTDKLIIAFWDTGEPAPCRSAGQ